jgi:glutamate--cysteine ligase
MSNPGEQDTTPIASVRQLADYLAAGAKPRAAFRIGTEHEKFGFQRPGHRPPPYEPRGIRAMLEGIGALGWEGIEDQGKLIGLKHAGESISLEPGGQFELSGAPLRTLHETRDELNRHFDAVHRVAEPLGLGFAPLGFHPVATRADMPFMPKSRYAIMRRYMQQVGSLGLDMMLRTCTVQVNLDFASEADMIR